VVRPPADHGEWSDPFWRICTDPGGNQTSWITVGSLSAPVGGRLAAI